MTSTCFHRDLAGASLDRQSRCRVAETLAIAPRDALAVFVGYGLNDQEIARYHGLPRKFVTDRREFWRIPPNL